MIRLSNFPACERLIIGLAFILVVAAPAGLAHGQGDGVLRNDHGGSLSTAFNKSETSGSGNCVLAHSALQDQVRSSSDSRSGSTIIGISAQNPLWQAELEADINQSHPFQTLVVDRRSHCHTLMARVQALPNGFPAVLTGSGFLIPAHPVTGTTLDGLPCARCHQI